MKRCLSIILLFASLLALAGCETGGPIYHSDPVLQAGMERLKTNDAAEIRQRWGDLADLVEKSWVLRSPNGDFSFYDLRWKVPGAVIGMKMGGCVSGKCAIHDITMLHRQGTRTFDFVMNDGERHYKGEVYSDGHVYIVASMGYGAVYDYQYIRKDNTLKSSIWYYQQGTRQEIAAATGFTLPEPDRLAATQPPANRSVAAPSPQQKTVGASITKAAQATPVQTAADYADTFQLIAGNGTTKGKVIAAKGSAKPVIYVLDVKAGQKLNLTTTAERFNPGITVYRAEDRSKVGARAGLSPLTYALDVKQTGPYLVAVYSVDPGKGGDFSLEVTVASTK